MKKIIIDRIMIFGCFVVLTMLAVTTQAIAQNAESGNVKTSITKVKTFNGAAVIPYAGASLMRNNDGMFATISTSGLTPGHVVTLWWAIFNYPRFCATPDCAPSDLNNYFVKGSLQSGGGYLVGADGRADFGGYLGKGDNTGFYILPGFGNMLNPAPGIIDTNRATIHLVIRDHGPASSDPLILEQQLTTFPGGCSIYNCANVQAAVFPQ